VKEHAEEGPRGQRKALLVEGPEHDRLGRVLRRELLPEAALPPGDLLLQEDATLHHILDVARARGPGRHDCPAHFRDYVSDPARGLGAIAIWCVSVTQLGLQSQDTEIVLCALGASG
jgi:hypothetical protein